MTLTSSCCPRRVAPYRAAPRHINLVAPSSHRLAPPPPPLRRAISTSSHPRRTVSPPPPGHLHATWAVSRPPLHLHDPLSAPNAPPCALRAPPHLLHITPRALCAPPHRFRALTPSTRPVPMSRASPAVYSMHRASSMPRRTGFVPCRLRSPSRRLHAPWGCLSPLPVVFALRRALSMPRRALFAPRPRMPPRTPTPSRAPATPHRVPPTPIRALATRSGAPRRRLAPLRSWPRPSGAVWCRTDAASRLSGAVSCRSDAGSRLHHQHPLNRLTPHRRRVTPQQRPQ
ncbi:hypothetical protein DENSPDRAFT_887424 [Dentipellis sp. KUC8613]|nr:hypothetical protein DENSPDRAFT_887424 [Dentipellis sp. KUC8613]